MTKTFFFLLSVSDGSALLVVSEAFGQRRVSALWKVFVDALHLGGVSVLAVFLVHGGSSLVHALERLGNLGLASLHATSLLLHTLEHGRIHTTSSNTSTNTTALAPQHHVAQRLRSLDRKLQLSSMKTKLRLQPTTQAKRKRKKKKKKMLTL